MSVSKRVLGALVITTLAMARPALAQDHKVSLFGLGGGFNGVTSLDNRSSADFKSTGYNVGGGLGVRLHRYVSLRGNFTYARNELQLNSRNTGNRLNRYYYDAALQLQYPVSANFEPYIFAGGGAVTLDPAGTSGGNKTKGTGTFGLGFNYAIPRSPFGVFAQGQSWLYKLDGLNGQLAGFNKTQFEIAWSGGLSYQLPF
jgi:hypothetical protein